MDKQLEQAYRQAEYHLPLANVLIKIGTANAHLDELLLDNNAWSWAFVTACNPASKLLNEQENTQRQQALTAVVRKMGLRFTEAFSSSPADDWPREQSIFIFDITLEQAVDLGRQFSQHAIVFGRLGKEAELVWCGGKA